MRWILVREAQGPIERMRPLAQAVTGMSRTVFVGSTERPPALLVAASADGGRDAGAMLRTALERVGGRGGGNPRIGQGTAPSAAALEDAIAAIAPDGT